MNDKMRGIYDKYIIEHNEIIGYIDGKIVDNDNLNVKEVENFPVYKKIDENNDYFVLNYTKNPAEILAMLFYAKAQYKDFAALSNDIRTNIARTLLDDPWILMRVTALAQEMNCLALIEDLLT